jgi:hypothetical protein
MASIEKTNLIIDDSNEDRLILKVNVEETFYSAIIDRQYIDSYSPIKDYEVVRHIFLNMSKEHNQKLYSINSCEITRQDDGDFRFVYNIDFFGKEREFEFLLTRSQGVKTSGFSSNVVLPLSKIYELTKMTDEERKETMLSIKTFLEKNPNYNLYSYEKWFSENEIDPKIINEVINLTNQLMIRYTFLSKTKNLAMTAMETDAIKITCEKGEFKVDMSSKIWFSYDQENGDNVYFTGTYRHLEDIGLCDTYFTFKVDVINGTNTKTFTLQHPVLHVDVDT